MDMHTSLIDHLTAVTYLSCLQLSSFLQQWCLTNICIVKILWRSVSKKMVTLRNRQKGFGYHTYLSSRMSHQCARHDLEILLRRFETFALLMANPCWHSAAKNLFYRLCTHTTGSNRRLKSKKAHNTFQRSSGLVQLPIQWPSSSGLTVRPRNDVFGLILQLCVMRHGNNYRM